MARTRALAFALSRALAWALFAGVAAVGCSDSKEGPASEGGIAASNAPAAAGGEQAAQNPQGPQNPLDIFVEQAGSYLLSVQGEDGSWPYFHSTTPDFSNPEPHTALGTPITLVNLTHTGFEASSAFKKGSDYLRARMVEGFVWSVYEPAQFGDAAWVEPDADNTAVCLTVLAGRLAVDAAQIKKLRALFDKNRAPDGLYRTYFDGFYKQKGFVPDGNEPSLGVNLNILGFFGKYEQPRAGLLDAIKTAMKQERYWEKTPYYHSLPVLAYLASNAVEHGAPEAGELMTKMLADFAAGPGAAPDFAEKLPTVELAAYVKARSHSCLLDQKPCPDIDLKVFQLARRRQADGSWPAAPFYEYDTNPQALEAFAARRDFTVKRARGGVAFDVDRALAAPGAVHYYDGSPAETTSFALKALVFYRELLHRRSSLLEKKPSPGRSPAAAASPARPTQ